MNDNSSSNRGHTGDFYGIFSGNPASEKKDPALSMERKMCAHCKRRTPHKHGVCQWHPAPD